MATWLRTPQPLLVGCNAVHPYSSAGLERSDETAVKTAADDIAADFSELTGEHIRATLQFAAVRERRLSKTA